MYELINIIIVTPCQILRVEAFRNYSFLMTSAYRADSLTYMRLYNKRKLFR
jgi:hypothetical protein